MKTIVVGFDESERAERALGRAADLAEALGAILVVTSVAVPPIPGPGLDAALPGVPEQLVAGAVDEFDLADQHLEQARRLLEARPVRAEFVSQAGSPAERIVALADERDADLIVVGAHDAGFLERLLGGSVSDDVARQARHDVLIVH